MKHVWRILVLAVLGWAMAGWLGGMQLGEPKATAMDQHYIENAREDTGTNNVVTSIVFDYRGFDTLGEASVLFTAVLGVGLVLRRVNREEEEGGSDEE